MDAMIYYKGSKSIGRWHEIHYLTTDNTGFVAFNFDEEHQIWLELMEVSGDRFYSDIPIH